MYIQQTEHPESENYWLNISFCQNHSVMITSWYSEPTLLFQFVLKECLCSGDIIPNIVALMLIRQDFLLMQM